MLPIKSQSGKTVECMLRPRPVEHSTAQHSHNKKWYTLIRYHPPSSNLSTGSRTTNTHTTIFSIKTPHCTPTNGNLPAPLSTTPPLHISSLPTHPCPEVFPHISSSSTAVSPAPPFPTNFLPYFEPFKIPCDEVTTFIIQHETAN